MSTVPPIHREVLVDTDPASRAFGRGDRCGLGDGDALGAAVRRGVHLAPRERTGARQLRRGHLHCHKGWHLGHLGAQWLGGL